MEFVILDCGMIYSLREKNYQIETKTTNHGNTYYVISLDTLEDLLEFAWDNSDCKFDEIVLTRNPFFGVESPIFAIQTRTKSA